eukprot:TRINITY_DN5755_c0_g1_i1.p1 TRINITY_DN5755_c0_g1~~TRINITY_DN5755_c0_g1_i1.p1  ORF type:complete len:87 (+),score=5.39 TRINITY_DN5755_c0_g1_i1:194-454(+)
MHVLNLNPMTNNHWELPVLQSTFYLFEIVSYILHALTKVEILWNSSKLLTVVSTFFQKCARVSSIFFKPLWFAAKNYDIQNTLLRI